MARFLVEVEGLPARILAAPGFFGALEEYETWLNFEHARSVPDESAAAITNHVTGEQRGYINPEGFWERDDDALDWF